MKKSISVPEMYSMLGISKVSGYDLLKKGYFKTIYICNHTRILIDSFEEWYAHQFYYRKVDGEPPGKALRQKYYTEEDVQVILGITRPNAYNLVRRSHFKTKPIERRKLLIEKRSFEDWYASQLDYSKPNGPPPGANYRPTYSAKEIRLRLGLKKRDAVYRLIQKNGIRYQMINGAVRIDRDEFDAWYNNNKR